MTDGAEHTAQTTQEDQCHRCGSDASLAAADQNGVFRSICKSCFYESHGGKP